MTYVIYKLTSTNTGRLYIGYETTESDCDSNTNDLIAAMREVSDKCHELPEHFLHSYLRQNVPENEPWKSLRGFMDAFNSVENGYNTEEEYEKISAQIIKQNLKAATQNRGDSPDVADWHEPLHLPPRDLPTPLFTSDLVSLRTDHGISPNAALLYLYFHTISGNQLTGYALEQAAGNLFLPVEVIRQAYDELVEEGLIEELHTFQIKGL